MIDEETTANTDEPTTSSSSCASSPPVVSEAAVSLAQYATVAFNRYYLAHRCTALEEGQMCRFKGHSSIKRVGDVPLELAGIPFTTEEKWWLKKEGGSGSADAEEDSSASSDASEAEL